MDSVYENIKRRRLELGLTQAQLAEKTGYKDKTAISRIEHGLVDIPVSKLFIIAEALDIHPRDLTGWK